MPPSDRHIRRSGSDYASAFLALLPQGQAWTRDPQSILVKTVNGLCGFWGFVDGRIADLLERESDPRQATDVTLPNGLPDGLLLDWERNWGLPDACFPPTLTIAERQRMLVTKMTWLGGQSRAYFEGVMDWLGFDITVKEFAPFMAGVSSVGDTRPVETDENGFKVVDEDGNFVIDTSAHYRWYIGPPEMRFYWTINAGVRRVQWFRAASSQAGVDPHCRLSVDDDLQCLLNRWKPAHTDLVLDTSGSADTSDPMYGTP